MNKWVWALVAAQVMHALTFAAHHTACIALVSHYFPGRLRGRGQAMFTIMGYGLGGTLGVLAGGAIASTVGFAMVFWVASVLGVLGALCAWRVWRLEHPRVAA